MFDIPGAIFGLSLALTMVGTLGAMIALMLKAGRERVPAWCLPAFLTAAIIGAVGLGATQGVPQ